MSLVPGIKNARLRNDHEFDHSIWFTTVRSDVEERVAEEHLAGVDKNAPA